VCGVLQRSGIGLPGQGENLTPLPWKNANFPQVVPQKQSFDGLERAAGFGSGLIPLSRAPRMVRV